jgi:hypothetical protein
MRNGYAIEKISCCNFTAVTSNLTASISADSYLAGATAKYTFTITTTNTLSATASVIVLFPIEYSLSSSTGTCASASGTNVSTTPTCTINSPRTLTVTNLLTAGLSGGRNIIFQAGSILNPSQALTTSQFTISTVYETAGGIVDISSNQQVVIIPSMITSVIVTPSNTVTNQLANYNFQIQNTNSLSSGSFIQLQVPADIIVGTLSCFVNTSIVVTCQNISATVINITGVVSNSVAVGLLKNSPITIVGLTNPTTFKPTGSFAITIYTSTFISIEALSSGITVVMTTATTLTSLSITPSNMLTGQQATYLISLSTPFVLTNNSNMSISFPQ